MTHRAHKGFTLIELLVAISILAIVAVLGWRGLDGIIRSRQALTGQMEQTRGMQLAFAQMQSDCASRAERELLHNRDNLLAENGRLTLVRLVFAENEASRLQVVSYRIRDGVLSRRESAATRDLLQLDALWQAALSDTDTSPSVMLQAGVAGMTMRLWQGNGWRAAAGASPQQPGVPAAVAAPLAPTGLEVSLQLEGQAVAIVKAFLLGAV
jgi:general secretion pathway protein J